MQWQVASKTVFLFLVHLLLLCNRCAEENHTSFPRPTVVLCPTHKLVIKVTNHFCTLHLLGSSEYRCAAESPQQLPHTRINPLPFAHAHGAVTQVTMYHCCPLQTHRSFLQTGMQRRAHSSSALRTSTLCCCCKCLVDHEAACLVVCIMLCCCVVEVFNAVRA
jgi:hypothetical protein